MDHGEIGLENEVSVNEIEEKGESTLNPHIKKLIEDYLKELERQKEPFTPLHVDEITSRFARLYETLRKVVDWKDDNALRRNAVERVLNRILLTKITNLESIDLNTKKLAGKLTNELIRGGHLPNGKVPAEAVIDVEHVLNKYIYLIKYCVREFSTFQIKERINFATFVIETAACEVEEVLTKPVKEYGLIDAMAKIMSERLTINSAEPISEIQKERWIYIAVYRSLYGLDDNFILYRLIHMVYPNWRTIGGQELEEAAQEFIRMWKELPKELENPAIRKIMTVTDRTDTPFMLVDDILNSLKNKPGEVMDLFEDKPALLEKAKEEYQKRYKTLKTRLLRLSMFSTLSVFLSNWVTFFIVEVPLAQVFYEKFNLFAAIVDFIVPTIVMFLLVSMIRPPKPSNEGKAIELMATLLYTDEAQEGYQVSLRENQNSAVKFILDVMYVFTVIMAFAFIAVVFYIGKLPITSVIFDTFTIALTVFAAVGIGNKAKELTVEENSGVRAFLFDIISVPVAKVGAYLANKWKEYNVIAVFFNFVFETPFVLFLDFIQEWSKYIRERKSEFR